MSELKSHKFKLFVPSIFLLGVAFAILNCETDLPVFDDEPPLPPDITLIAVSPPDSLRMVSVSGREGAVEPNALVRIENTKRRVSVQTTALDDGSFGLLQIEFRLGDRLFITATDAEGNVSDVVDITPRLDTIPPDPPDTAFIFVTSPDPNGLVSVIASFGATEEGATLKIENITRVANAQLIAPPIGAKSEVPIFAVVEEMLRFIAIDISGNISEPSFKTVKLNPPPVELLRVSAIDNFGKVNIRGGEGAVKGLDTVVVTLMNLTRSEQVSTRAFDNGSFFLSIAVSEGDSLNLFLTDDAGHISENITFVAEFDRIPPPIPNVEVIDLTPSQFDPETGANFVEVTGRPGAVEGGTIVTVFNSTTRSDSATVDANEDGSFEKTRLNGTFNDQLVGIFATDIAGNVSQTAFKIVPRPGFLLQGERFYKNERNR